MNTHWFSQFLIIRVVDLVLLVLFLLAFILQTIRKLSVYLRK
jgi:hypothetical protein